MASSCFSPSVMSLNDITPVRLPAEAGFGLPLLERIAETGSLHDAASALGLDESLAWQYLVAANNLSEVPLVRLDQERLAPTRHACALLGRPTELERAFNDFLDAPGSRAFGQFELRRRILRRIGARTSARNQFYCRIVSVRRERVNAVVLLDLGHGDRLSAHITTRSASDLGLAGGGECHALVDPGWVEVRPDEPGDCSRQQNCLQGRVMRCVEDPVDTEVAIELAGGRIVIATMTHAEMAEKGIHTGCPVQVVIQSSQIILAVDAPCANGGH